MGLFKDQDVLDVVTVDDIKALTGLNPDDLFLDQQGNPADALKSIVEMWITRIASHIHVRLEGQISKDDKGYEAMKDVITRYVGKLVGTAMQMRSTPIVQIDDFAVEVLDTSDVIEGLDDELTIFRRTMRSRSSRVNVFWSSQGYTG